MPHRARRLLASAALLMITFGGLELFYLRMFFADRTELRERLAGLPYRKLPGYPEFLAAVMEQTREGDVIVLLTPHAGFEEGYRYAHSRAAYVLEGRRVLAVLGPDDRRDPGAFDRADVVVGWRVKPPPGIAVTWDGADGFVARRER